MYKINSIGEILFDVYDMDKKLGGAPFNFIFHILNLTGEGNIISRIGNDNSGKDILKFLNSNNISTKYIQIDHTHQTGEARAVLNEKKIPEWTIMENAAYDFIEISKELEILICENTDCFYFGTLAQRGENSRKTIQSLLQKKVRLFCDLNIRQNFYSMEIIEVSLNAADVLKLNIEELLTISNYFCPHLSSAEKFKEISKFIIRKFNIDLLCVTMGEKGAALFRNGKYSCCSKPISEIEIIDTVGAGDAYAAILCIGYLNNWDIDKINILASEFASEIVKINGALPSNNYIYDGFRKKIGC
jgi:fructokinase